MILSLICYIYLINTQVQASYNYTDVLHKSILFYEAQRSGRLPSNNRIPWRGDSGLADGRDNGLDLTGGWHDAGDFVKFGFPMSFAVTLLSWGLVDFKSAYLTSSELDNARDSIKWALDYFIKCHVSDNEFYGQVGNGTVDHSYWGRPEDMTMFRPSWSINTSAPGSDLAGETAAAMAASSMVFRDTDPEYAKLLLNHARSLYDFAYNYRGRYSDSIVNAFHFYRSRDYKDELCWGAAWLYRATGDVQYLQKATEFYDSSLQTFFTWNNKYPGAQMMMYITTHKQQYADDVKRFLTYYLPGGGVTYTPKGLAWVGEWGSLKYAADASLIALVAAKYGIMPEKALTFAESQIHYILGDGGRSYVVGFGNNPPTHAHHEAASCPWPPKPCGWKYNKSPDPNPHVLYGAVVGGPGKLDNYTDIRTNYVINEVACGYNAGFQSAIAGLIEFSTGRMIHERKLTSL